MLSFQKKLATLQYVRKQTWRDFLAILVQKNCPEIFGVYSMLFASRRTSYAFPLHASDWVFQLWCCQSLVDHRTRICTQQGS